MEILNILFYIIIGIFFIIIHLGSAAILKTHTEDYDWWKKQYNIILLIPPISILICCIICFIVLGIFITATIKQILD